MAFNEDFFEVMYEWIFTSASQPRWGGMMLDLLFFMRRG